MNKEHNDYYYTLRLQPGASPGEIKAAFRHLAKLYHPDHDQSLDAEMKYKEIQVAYKMLLNTSDTAAESNSSESTTWAYDIPPSWQENNQESASSEQTAHTTYDWAPEYYHVNFKLEWKTLPALMFNSLMESLRAMIFDGEGGLFVLKGSLALAAAVTSYGGWARRFDLLAPLPPYTDLAMQFYITSWILYTLLRVLFRYHFAPPAWLFSTKTVTGIVYGLILVFLIACFYTVPISELLFVGFCAAVSMWVLMIKF